jgi:hypothetical protein
MTIYQLHYVEPNGSLFALPVFGDKRSIWDAFAKHRHFKTYRTFCEVQGVNPIKHKANFKLIEVKP